MRINKITTGFVIQTYDTEKKQFVSQEFIAGECQYENEKGETVDRNLLNQENGSEAYLPFEMLQPGPLAPVSSAAEEKGFALHELDSTYAGSDERFVVSLIVTYRDREKHDPKTPKQAVAAALAITTDEGSAGTHWYCFDRATGKIHMIEQGET